MRVRVTDQVFEDLTSFYDVSLRNHPALDEATVLAKEQRLINALERIGQFPYGYRRAKYKARWIAAGYRDFHHEGFHFGYRVETLPSGEKVVVVYEACHDLLYT